MKRLGICLLLISLFILAGSAQAHPQLQMGGTTIAYGDTITGNLTATTAAEGDRYIFDGSEGDIVIISLESADFDTILDLLDAAGTQIATNDDAQGKTNSLIAFALPATATYTIVARNFGSGTGAYTLTLTLAELQPITIGETVESILSSPAGDRYEFSASQGDIVTITLESDAFDTYLELFDREGTRLEYNDDSGSVRASQLTYTFPQDGTYIIVARAYNAGSGTYTLSLEQGEATQLPNNPGVPSGTVLEYGQTISGSLNSANEERYTFVGTEGDLVIITLESPVFDAYLTLLDPNTMELAVNDDGGEGSNSQIAVKLPVSGTYTIVASSYSSGASAGRFDLSIELAQAPTSTELSYGDSATVMLMSPAGDQWTFNGTAGDMVSITVQTEAFDSVVDLIGPDGQQVASNDTAANFIGSEIVTTLPTTGTYDIVVRDFSSTQNGVYTLSVRTVTVQAIESGQTVNGELLGIDGDRYTFTAPAGTPVIITMNSTAFDTYLEIYDSAQNLVTYNDDSGGSTSMSRVLFTTSDSETYTILARSFGSTGPFGRYTLSFETAQTELIEYREPVQATLTNSEGDFYSFQGTAGDYVSIVMESTQFDTYLELYDPSGLLLMSNDDAGSTSRSEIDASLPETGVYIIVASSLSHTGSGDYTLEVTPGTPPPTPGVNPAKTISYGDTIEGNLVSPNADSYEFEGTAGDIVTITLTAAYDTYLELYDAAMVQVTYNDDANDSLNSAIENFVLPSDGIYTIYARGLSTDISGPYTLTLAAVTESGLPADAPQIGVLSDVACGTQSSYFVFTFDPSQGPNYNTFQASLQVDEPGGIIKIIPVGEPLTQSFSGEATIALDDQVLYLANATSVEDITAQINEGLSRGPAHTATLQINNTEGQPTLSFLFWVNSPLGISGIHGTAYWVEQQGQAIQSANYGFMCP